ncbi:MAG: hypothetical protein JXB88_20095 [Spirochaetales bacterium]|nr:hypothetical protein [Spirochaetales bacterium]
MMMVQQLSVFVMIVISLISSPIQDTQNVFIDAIERDIEPIYCMLQKDGQTVKCYEYKKNGDLSYIFSIELAQGEDTEYTVKTPDGKTQTIDLINFLSQTDIKRIKDRNLDHIEVEMKDDNGALYIVRIGTVTYVRAKAFREVLFTIHE